jgi:hypothetical protein
MGFKKPEKPKVVQPLNIEPERTATNRAVRPWPVIWGTHRLGGTYIDAIWNYRTEAITERIKTGKNSKETITKAINYFGSIALGVSFGPLHKVLSVIKDDKSIWSGDLVVGTPDYYSINLESENSPMIIYTGEQEPGTVRGGGDTDQEFLDGHPTYKGLVYFLFDQLLFGTAPNPPNFEVIIEVIHRSLILDPENETGDPNNDDIELHRVDSGQLVPEIIYSALTNPLFGGAMTSDDFDLPSWTDACNQLRTEGSGYSAKLDAKTASDSWIKDLLNFAHAEITPVNGKLSFRLKRSGDTVISVPEAAFVKDPQITPGSWNDSEVVNEIRVPYALLSRDLDPLNTVQSDDSSRSIIGLRSKTFSFDGIRSEVAATQLASRFVRALGFPVVRYTMQLDHSMRGLQKGDLIAPVYEPRGLDGNTKLRVSGVTRSAPGRGGVTIRAEVDKTSLADTLQGDSDDEIVYSDPEPSEVSGHLLSLPTEFLESFSDGAFIPIARESASDDRAIISFGWDGTVYDNIIATGYFPLRLDVTEWRDFGDGAFSIEFEFANEHEETSFLDSVGDNLPDWHLMTKASTGSLLNPSLSVIRRGSSLQSLGSGVYVLSFESGQFGTPSFGYTGTGPSSICYLAPLYAFTFYRSNQKKIFLDEGNSDSDTAKIRRLNIQSATRGKVQDFDDGYGFTYNRATDVLAASWGGNASHAFDYGITPINDNGAAPLAFSIDISGTEAFDYEVDWGDGSSVETGSGVSGDDLPHSYTVAGSYTAELTITPSAGGASQMFSIPVTVT